MRSSGLTLPQTYNPLRHPMHHAVDVFRTIDCGRCPAVSRGSCWRAYWQFLACMASRRHPEGTPEYESLYEAYKEDWKAEEQTLCAERSRIAQWASELD